MIRELFARKGKAQGATEYLLMLAAVLVIVAVAVYYVTRAGGYPAVSVTAQTDAATQDNIQLVVSTGGPIAAGDWQYCITATKGTHTTWVTPTYALAQGTINLENAVAAGHTGTQYVSIKHVPSGHLYLDDVSVTVA